MDTLTLLPVSLPSLPPSLPPIGPFLPNYQANPSPPFSYGLQRIDHVVSNVPQLLPVVNHLMRMTVRKKGGREGGRALEQQSNCISRF